MLLTWLLWWLLLLYIYCWEKKVSLNLEATKGKIIYFYKSVNFNFCITFEILPKLQELPWETWIKPI